MTCRTSKIYLRHPRKLHSILLHAVQTAQSRFFRFTPKKNMYSSQSYCDATLEKQILVFYDGQQGFIIFRLNGDTVQPTHWGARKLRKMPRDSATVEILADARTTKLLQYFKTLLKKVYYIHPAGPTTNSTIDVRLATSIPELAKSFNRVALAAIGKISFWLSHVCQVEPRVPPRCWLPN